jgi:hypothetical protein
LYKFHIAIKGATYTEDKKGGENRQQKQETFVVWHLFFFKKGIYQGFFGTFFLF